MENQEKAAEQQRIFEDLGITPERQIELEPIHQKVMDDIKNIFKENGIEEYPERILILSNISKKCSNVGKLYYVVWNGQQNEEKQKSMEESKEENTNE